ncbi:MAG: 3-phosphoshikimate 1-carboxyvinyltransferase [Dethiobacter sp.]|jgi:3-phosphoshikimate 1-carboxyvinyltransferase|nr:MAG: 3-phosphoshikimate 1-carboxyvinyltransferase [Dethiobacter sp.]
MEITIKPVERIEGQTRVPGDKSISHRALLFSSLTEDTVEIENLLEAEDTLSTLNCLRELGVEYEGDGKKLKVKGKGLRGFEEPDNVLNAGNSGTTARLLAGLLAGQPFHSTLTGDGSLRRRPMNRVTEPLKQMGASINGRNNGELLPLSIRGYDLLPINYTVPVASSQVKSALLIAALYSRGTSEIIDLYNTRDHTERALRYLGARIEKMGRCHIILKSPVKLKGDRFRIPGDISEAAFLIVAAALAPRGELYIEDVGINPSRTGILEVLERMGADISILNEREYNYEPVADLLVKGGRNLKGTEIAGEMIPRVIDEIPVLAVAALFAEGDTVIKGAAELRVKKTDRLKCISLELQKMGALVEELPDGLVIKGGAKLSGARCESHGDHRIAMALATAALFAESESVINGVEAVKTSFPGFFDIMSRLAS